MTKTQVLGYADGAPFKWLLIISVVEITPMVALLIWALIAANK